MCQRAATPPLVRQRICLAKGRNMNLPSNLRFNANKRPHQSNPSPTIKFDIASPEISSTGTEPWPATLGRGHGKGLSLQSVLFRHLVGQEALGIKASENTLEVSAGGHELSPTSSMRMQSMTMRCCYCLLLLRLITQHLDCFNTTVSITY